ncbi:MAG: metal ABC transporter substrate-binding protein [Promethearchaeota archaeon]
MRKNSRNWLVAFTALFTLVSISFLAGPSTAKTVVKPSTTKLKIATTVTIPEDIVRGIAGDEADILSIVSGTEDPHTYSGPTPSEKDFLESADIVFRLGEEGLEPWWEDTASSLTNQPTVVTLVQGSMVETDPLTGRENPHVWTDPNNMKVMAATVLQTLKSADPERAATYEANARAYNHTMDVLLTWIGGNRTAFQGRKIVVHHPGMMYFLDLLGVERVAVIEEQHGVEPSAEHIDNIIQDMKDQNVTLLANQIGLDESKVVEIARATNASIVDLTPLLGVQTPSGTVVETYTDLIDYNLRALANPHEPSGADVDGFPVVSSLGALGIGTALTSHLARGGRKGRGRR